MSKELFTYEITNQDTLTNGTIIYNFNTKEEDLIVDYKDGRSAITKNGRTFHVSAHALGGGWKPVIKKYTCKHETILDGDGWFYCADCGAGK